MTSRVLPPDEWPRLQGTEAETLWPHLSADNSRVLVVEQDGAIVGTWVVMRLVHVDAKQLPEVAQGRLTRRPIRGLSGFALFLQAAVVGAFLFLSVVLLLLEGLLGFPAPAVLLALLARIVEGGHVGAGLHI